MDLYLGKMNSNLTLYSVKCVYSVKCGRLGSFQFNQLGAKYAYFKLFVVYLTTGCGPVVLCTILVSTMDVPSLILVSTMDVPSLILVSTMDVPSLILVSTMDVPSLILVSTMDVPSLILVSTMDVPSLMRQCLST